MIKFVIEGGIPLIGRVKLSGAKNAGFKEMIAALFTDEEVVLGNISKVSDVSVLKDIIADLGGKVENNKNHEVRIIGKGIKRYQVDERFGSSARVSSMLAGPILYRFGKASFPSPGGDKIGQRPIDRHIDGLIALGAKVERTGEYFFVKARKLKGTTYRFAKSTHTGTETLIMCAVWAQGKTVLQNAAAEPEIDDLIELLNKMGAKIKRTKKREIEIEGVTSFKGTQHSVMPDRNEAVTYACMALGTLGDVFIETARKADLEAFIQKVEEAGGGVEEKFGGVRFFTKGPLKPTYLETEIHPGFMTDWQALWTTLMTCANGESTIHERVFESRFAFVTQLKSMGANIELFSPKIKDPASFYEFNYQKKDQHMHAVKVVGPTKLRGTSLEVSDIRAGATLVLAALMADGRSDIYNIEHIERGYENLENKLRGLGAKIYKV